MTTTECSDGVTLVFNYTPLWILCGIAGAFILLSVAIHIREWLEERSERKAAEEREEEEREVSLDTEPRREALELIAKLGTVREKMLELDRALMQRREGAHWQFRIGDNADNAFRDADDGSEIDGFLSFATGLELDDAIREMISLFRGAANWLKKYAPEEAPPPSFREKAANAFRTFFGIVFPALKQAADTKTIPVVEKAEKKRLSDISEAPEKVASDETPTDEAADSGESPKAREKLRIPFDLLERRESGNRTDAASLRENAKYLADTLRTYKIDAVPSGTPVQGPSVTRYDFRLLKGVKLNKLMSLSNDIAFSMGVNSVRIAPVPGKSSIVGIETPNPELSAVALRGILESRDFMYGHSTAFALGRGMDDEIVTGDLEELPHVLIAGTTGSGKSVCLNSMIVSLLYKSAPEELRFLMIDPKMVELSAYNGIPHLSQPVVTNAAQAVAALQQAAVGMDVRYKTFTACGVRTLDEYNRKMKQSDPRIVIVIDELADLMMTAEKEIEDSIIRIAAMGRAAGIHLVVATQRPSSDVITGLMKANIPSRIALKVTSAMESRLILDSAGAEKLVGNGDMLYAPQGGERKRVQGCYVSMEEIEKVVAFLKTK